MSDGENNSLPDREEVKTSPSKDDSSKETNNVACHENDKKDTESEDVEMKPGEKTDDAGTKSPKKSSKKKREPKEEKSDVVNEDKTDGDTVSQTTIKSPKKDKAAVEEVEDDDDDDEPQVGLLEQPVVLEAGRKRERKKVERIEIVGSASHKDKTVEIPEGDGEKLGDIPWVEFKLSKTTADDLKPLHRILFNRFGSATEVKRNIRKFCGFTFKATDPEYEKKVQHLNKLTLTVLKSLCELLHVERKGTKEDIVNRIMKFLMKPASSGKALPKSKRKRSSSSKGKKQKTKSKGKDKDDKKKTSRSPKKKPAKSKEEVDDESDQDNDDEDEEEAKESEGEVEQKDQSDEEEAKSEEEKSEEDSGEDWDEKPPKKKKQKKELAKKAPVKKETKKAAKKEAKKPATKKTPSKAKKRLIESDSEDEASSDDEPLVAKKKPPTDDELRDVIKKILDHADLQEVTMKTVCKQVYDKYPEFDLVPRKDFIKTTVKQIIR